MDSFIVVVAFKVKAMMYPGMFWGYFFSRVSDARNLSPLPPLWGLRSQFILSTLLEDAFHRQDSHNILGKKTGAVVYAICFL